MGLVQVREWSGIKIDGDGVWIVRIWFQILSTPDNVGR